MGVEVQNKSSNGIIIIAITHTNESWITLWVQNKLYELFIMNKWDVRQMCESALSGMNYNSWSWNKDGEGREHGNVDYHIGLNKNVLHI